MKWLGQYIIDFIARFRSDVYLDSPTAGGSDPDKFLGIDSNNKIIYRTGSEVLSDIGAGSGDITGVVVTADDTNTVSDTAGSADFGIKGGEGIDTSVDGTDIVITGETASTTNPGVVELATTAETTTGTDTARAVTPDGLKDGYQGSANVTTLGTITSGEWNGDAIVKTYIDPDQRNITQVGTLTNLLLSSAVADNPAITITNTTDDDQAAQIIFNKLRADDGVATGQNVGEIKFDGQDSAQNTQRYAIITGEIDVSTHGQESGQLVLGVASHNGTVQSGLSLVGGSVAGEVDATIGRGTASVTTVAGTLTMGSTATLDNSGLLQVANQSNITGVGTISSGTWQGTAIASAYLDADTAHLSGAQTIGGVKTIEEDVKLQFRDANAYINSPEANDIEIAATDITLDADGTIKLEGPTRSTGQIHMTHHNFSDDIDTTKHYVGLARGDSENTATTQIQLPLVFPTAAKLLKIYLRSNQNLSAKEITFTLETQAAGVTFGTGPTIVGTKALSGPTNSSIVTYDMAAGHIDSGDNIVDAGDAAYLGIQSSASTSTTKFYITCVWEVDFSSI
ncbi:MAG: hypothetical protein GOVbin1709_26 [Prokaryotic dsDNA virus sp.]|nr:MAG: hypothetical protein GOVbin1709_26 [Prokaryotic dsDNA virus sp.]|tara:strand:- start:495 stop:2195 length:1701 start_codon:yes stop_codon:yes gene_type:complete